MVMKQSLVYLGNIIPTLYSKQPVFFHCSFGGCDVKKIRSNTLYANTNPPGNKSISHQTGRKIIFNSTVVRDMLVPRRVHIVKRIDILLPIPTHPILLV